jgi:hypothetical protein
MNNVEDIIDALNQHLADVTVIELMPGETCRYPAGHITCNDGSVLSIQASKYTYCTPRQDQGPWTHVEVMLIRGKTPTHWDHNPGDVDGYIPIEAVAAEIQSRGYLQVASQ